MLLISLTVLWMGQLVTAPFCNDVISIFLEAAILALTLPLAFKLMVIFPWAVGLLILLPTLIGIILGINIYFCILIG